jgi:hypothetical protein
VLSYFIAVSCYPASPTKDVCFTVFLSTITFAPRVYSTRRTTANTSFIIHISEFHQSVLFRNLPTNVALCAQPLGDAPHFRTTTWTLSRLRTLKLALARSCPPFFTFPFYFRLAALHSTLSPSVSIVFMYPSPSLSRARCSLSRYHFI